MRMILKDDVECDDIVVVPDMLPQNFREKQVVVPRSKATKEHYNLKPGKRKKGEKDNNPKGEKCFDDKQANVSISVAKEQAPFEESVLSEEMRNETIPVDYLDNRLESQSTSVLAYMQARTI